MNNDALKYQLANDAQALNPQAAINCGALVQQQAWDPFATQYFPQKTSLNIEPVEGGFIVAGYFAGVHRRCVAASVPALVKLLRSWSEQFKPKAES